MPKLHQGNTTEQKRIGAFIASLREHRGLTQLHFGKILGTSQSAIARMEQGKQNFSTEMLMKISKALGRNIIQLADNSIGFRIKGGTPLSGSVVTNTSKNGAVALLSASLINAEKTELKNVPRVEDVFSIIRVIESLGATVQWVSRNNVLITPPQRLNLRAIDRESAVRTRSTILLIGALLGREKSFSIPHSGGCKLGTRTVRPHVFALEKLGLQVKTLDDAHHIDTSKYRREQKLDREIVLYESGDTVTENAIMAASTREGTTVIKYASANYMVQELCGFLKLLGVSISGAGTTTLTVTGKPRIAKSITFTLGEDPTEAMFFLSVAATTKSAITIQRCPIDFLELELLKLEKMGFKYSIAKRYKSFNGFLNLADIRTYPSTLTALEEKIYARPFPGLNIDNLPFFAPIATQAKGTTLLHDWVYENRALYYLELTKLGAEMRLADPHRVYINGPTKLQAAEIICPPALRPAAIILIAMLAAEGTSTLRNVYSINRGYENLYTRLRKLGANIDLLQEI